MSTFLGLIEEIPGISVDRFDGANLNSFAYFLSHCHTDHMQGLSNWFFERLRQYNKYLYCSRISKAFLESKYNTETCVKDLDIDEKVSIECRRYGETRVLTNVTCISAGHCPGSVMFLFEKSGKLILYTGDFRINPRDYSKLTSLNYRRDLDVLPRRLAKVYLDTTFLDRNFAHLPTRLESMNVMGKVVREWLEASPRKVVVLECSALYGSEFLYIELSKVTKTSIHVKNVVFESYCRIPDLARHITNDRLATRIHACMNKNAGTSHLDRSGLECRPDVLVDDVLTVVPSVQKWRDRDTRVVGEWDKTRRNTFNIFYSTHASFEELKKFVQYFRPAEIYPSVCPENVKHTVFHLLNEIRS